MRSAGEIESDARELAAVDVTLLPDVTIKAEILTLIRTINICYAALWRRVSSFDRRGLATGDGHRSTGTWLRAFGHLSIHTAGSTVAKAGLLEQLPMVAAAAQDGRMSPDHLTRLVTLADDVGVEPIRQVEDILAGVADRFSPEDLSHACDRVRITLQLLTDRLRVLGPDHPDTLATRHNLAYWRGEAGDPPGAATAFDQLLTDHLRMLGPDHPDTLTARANLARWRAEAGDPDGAATAFEQLLTDYLRVLGPDHPDTLAVRRELAYWHDRPTK